MFENGKYVLVAEKDVDEKNRVDAKGKKVVVRVKDKTLQVSRKVATPFVNLSNPSNGNLLHAQMGKGME